MYGNRQSPRARRGNLIIAAIPWLLVLLSVIISIGAIIQLNHYKRDASKRREALSLLVGGKELDSTSRAQLAQSEPQVASLFEEREALLASKREYAQRLAVAESHGKNATSGLTDMRGQLTAAQERINAAEQEIKQITLLAGSCREEYNSLNAKCAAVKQGLANLGLTSQTVVEKKDSLSGDVEGALDPRGGMEAALVLKENSQQPWKAAEERNQVTRTETLNVTQAVKDNAHKLFSNDKARAFAAFSVGSGRRSALSMPCKSKLF